jgi:hypothetical protein
MGDIRWGVRSVTFLLKKDICRLKWVVDILEQVCSAVHEGPINSASFHRDLKPG